MRFAKNARFAAVLIAGAGILYASAAPAQPFGRPGNPSDPPEPGRLVEQRTAERTMQAFSRCLVNQPRTRILRFLRTRPDGRRFQALGSRLVDATCLPQRTGRVTVRFSPMLLRASLFDALYNHDFGGGAVPDVSRVPALDIDTEFEGGAENLPVEVVAIRVIGDCVARARPGLVHALVITSLRSDEESAAIEALMPALGGCVVRDGTLRINRTNLRGILAEAIYKLATAEPAPPVPPPGMVN